MNKFYKGQVNQLRSQLINQIKLTFINPDGEDCDIEFTEHFQIWQTANVLFTDDIMKVLNVVSGMKISSGNCILTGTDYNNHPFDDMELEEVWDLYELAHILDALTAGQYKILSNG